MDGFDVELTCPFIEHPHGFTPLVLGNLFSCPWLVVFLDAHAILFGQRLHRLRECEVVIFHHE